MVLLLLTLESSLCIILDISPCRYVVCKYFSQSVVHLFCPLRKVFYRVKVFKFDELQYDNFSFHRLCFQCHVQEFFAWNLKIFSYIFLKLFIVLHFIFNMYDLFWVSFLNKVWGFSWCPFFFFFYSPSSTEFPFSKIRWAYLYGPIYGLSVLFHLSRCLSLHQYHTALINAAVW